MTLHCESSVAEELSVLEHQRNESLHYYRDHSEEALALLSVGQQAPPPRDLAAELAARMIVASMILNLDEAITHE
jgi:hypothetical protein